VQNNDSGKEEREERIQYHVCIENKLQHLLPDSKTLKKITVLHGSQNVLD
jgi:hypothetical protein